MSTEPNTEEGGHGVDFVAVVDQALALLRQRGRVTYRTLQRQFQLDAEALTDLLAELRYAHPDEIREDDQGVVWTGEAGTAAALAPPSIPHDQHRARPAAAWMRLGARA